MRCSKCNRDNREGRKFCANCGAPLSITCPKCGVPNEPDERFCGECGAGLAGAAGPNHPEVTPIPPSGNGERRHLTVLFCDLVGSTEIAAQLDPEEWREVAASYHRAAAEAITRYGGQVAKYLGDGVMAYFGWPEAHENDAERAARAGLAILESVAKLNQECRYPKISVRVGIDSGAVVVGPGAGKDADIFGDAPNIAARVQVAAEPGTVLITAATHRLVSGLFVVEERGARALRGIAQPVALYRVIRPSGMRGRLAAAAAVRGMTSFINREEELRLLLNRWELVREGDGQVVTIVGEAGIGKSRLMQQFHDQIAADRHTWLECSTAAFFQNTPFHAIIEMLQQTFHFQINQNVEHRLAALEASLGTAGLNLEEAVPLIASLLELPLGGKYPPCSLPPDQRRKRLLAALAAWMIGFAKTQPLVMATEDLHWADPSTLELSQIVVEQGVTAPLLVLYTARPEFRAQWPLRAHHTQITLNRLSARHVRTMIGQVAAQKALSEETVNAVVERTSGVPLFVEELTRTVLETDAANLSGREIPVTLHDSLMARLDRLGSAKELLQIGAVIGNEFSYELMRAVTSIPEDRLQNFLRNLTAAELLYVRGIAPDATYMFKHALIRDAGYEALLKSRRKELHLIVARIINEKFSVIKETHPEVLAHHWSEAGEAEPAVTEWQRAGERALERRAYREAEQHYRDAIAILGTLRESSERDARELKLQVPLGVIVTATRGYSSSETKEAYARARVLIERTGGSASLEILNGLRGAAVTRGELRASLRMADEILRIASAIGSPEDLAAAHTEQGNTRYYLGDLTGAREHFRLSLENYRPQDFPNVGNRLDRVMPSYMWAGATEWFLGYPDRAVRYTEDGLALAQRSNNPFNMAIAFGFATHVYSFRGEFKRVVEVADQAIKVSSELGFPIWNLIAKIRRAWARAKSGVVSDGIDRIREALTELDSLKFYLARALYLSLLSETQAASGEIGEALVSVEQALQANPEEVIYHPAVLTLRGELRLSHDQMGKPRFKTSEQDFRDAIWIARSISAKSLELRATMSLARLLALQSRRDEARVMLAQIYGWFTEGFDTADLKDANALLDTLSA
jgi:class 3 adenylate cyclase/tetratricopeptide (TPR) repeat protein